MDADAVQRKPELGGPVDEVLFVEKLWLSQQKKRASNKENDDNATWPGIDLSKSKMKVVPLFKARTKGLKSAL